MVALSIKLFNMTISRNGIAVVLSFMPNSYQETKKGISYIKWREETPSKHHLE